jgi:hypothetical protein
MGIIIIIILLLTMWVLFYMHINFQNIKTGSNLFIYRHGFFLPPRADTVNTVVRYRKMFYGSTVPCLKETDFISKERIRA